MGRSQGWGRVKDHDSGTPHGSGRAFHQDSCSDPGSGGDRYCSPSSHLPDQELEVPKPQGLTFNMTLWGCGGMRSRSSERPSGSTFGEMWQKCFSPCQVREPTGVELGVLPSASAPDSGPHPPALLCVATLPGKGTQTLPSGSPGHLHHGVTPHNHPIITYFKPYAHVSTKASRNCTLGAFWGPLHTLEIATAKWGRRGKIQRAGRDQGALTNPQRSEGLGAEDMQTKGF